MKHTKGPWTVAKNKKVSGLYRILKADSNEGLAISGTLEDARLIAAAPELLEALFHAKMALMQSTYSNHLMQRIDAAISKVEGKKV